MVYSTRQIILSLALCYFVLVFFSPLSIAITSLGEERAILSVFCTFIRFVLVWLCRFSLLLGVWEGLRLVIGLFSYLFFNSHKTVSLIVIANKKDDLHVHESLVQSRLAKY